MGTALLALVAAGCGSVAAGDEASSDLARGKRLFAAKCGSCHTLRDAGTQGTIGPDLDAAFGAVREQGFDESTIRRVVRGQIAYPVPPMPANLVTGADADAVAAYVASAAGVAGVPEAIGPSGGQPTGGEDIFQANCGSCHTLADAGTTGTIGPSLDRSKPSLELAIERVTNGKGAMPAFEGRLSPDQIRAVAEYVASVAGE